MKTGRCAVSSIKKEGGKKRKREGEWSGGKRWGKGEKWKGCILLMQFFQNKVTKQNEN